MCSFRVGGCSVTLWWKTSAWNAFRIPEVKNQFAFKAAINQYGNSIVVTLLVSELQEKESSYQDLSVEWFMDGLPSTKGRKKRPIVNAQR